MPKILLQIVRSLIELHEISYVHKKCHDQESVDARESRKLSKSSVSSPLKTLGRYSCDLTRSEDYLSSIKSAEKDVVD